MMFSNPIVKILCLLLFFVQGCTNDDTENKKNIAFKGALEEVDSVEVLHSDGAILKIRLRTAKQFRLQNDDKIFPKKVFVDFFGQNKEIITTMVSDSGRYDATKNLYIVKGNVKVLKSQTQERLSTDELTWNPVTKKVYSDKTCILESLLMGEKMQGIGMTAEQDFSNLSLRKPKAIFNAPAGLSQ